MQSTDVVVIGGGVIGCSVAYNLAKKGVSVKIVEREDIASGTSGACDRAINLQTKNPGLHLKMAIESEKIFSDLQKELDTDVQFRTTGIMIAIQTEQQLEVMERFVKRQKESGLDVEILDKKNARERQPILSEKIVGSTYRAMDGEVHPQKLTLGYFRGAKKYGAQALLGTEVTSIKIKNGCVQSVLAGGEEILCKYVVNACGAYAPFIGNMVGIDIPIAPRRGQLIVTEPVPNLVYGTVNCATYITAKFRPELLGDGEEAKLGLGLSLGQTQHGNLLIGGTREFVGYNKNTTYLALKAILKHAVSIAPILKDINLIRCFAGLRPYTPDSLPIIGKASRLEGFIMAAGHEGDGLALSPITGKIISEIIADDKLSVDIDINKLSLDRFKDKDLSEFRKKALCS